ncbi:glycoside hydrolase family 15 protein [Nitrosococcus watsonii]|uniref:Glycoside hydrolase 15-related protein n=1 Tax=Nitrosococcus watsoni (strain C-113) TaxID=105559 RepID=D8K7E0_NITWC|nr:glycoside hydrolase family 15 protein [Nitrosococcus watsonii]ADJ28817.1 glycoside hydrolase 15-related protein [Nitrosococcus watsonii C-113]
MDLYTASKGLASPFVFTQAEEKLPIGAHGLIGDGFTCALVRADGAIDWLCLPRFDSPSVFAALLDPKQGGITALTPAHRPFKSLQGYDSGTNVLKTLFLVEGKGVVQLTDFMPWTNDPRLSTHEIHRRIQCIEGSVELMATFDPRFDYGEYTPSMQREAHGIIARGKGGQTLVAVLGGNSVQWEPRARRGVQAPMRLNQGEQRWMILSWNAPRSEPIMAYRPAELLRATRHRWREWSQRLQYDGPWRSHVLRSALLLKLLMFAPTGVMVAAPTTSLPEWISGRRNWDYRYTWTRDSAMAIHAANLIGYRAEARDFFHFVRDILEHTETLEVMYQVDGQPVPEERILSHLSGYHGSKPVRIGNGARTQIQLDTAGALVNAAFTHEQCNGLITLRAWRRIATIIEQVRSRWQQSDHGIWERRDSKHHHVHSKLMSWLALERGSRLAYLFGATEKQVCWAAAARQVRRDLWARGLDARQKHFVMAYGLEEPDAALLLLPLHGFVKPQDPHMLATIDWLRSELGYGPFLYRYQNFDGVGGKEGAFILCGFWLAELLAMAGRIEEAQRVFMAHIEASNHLGLLAEEIVPETGELLGNFPQAFSYLGLINAAVRIDLALRLRDEGSRKIPRFLLETLQHEEEEEVYKNI